MIEQQKPDKGQQKVLPEVLNLFSTRIEKGVRTYGRELETFNGRDALRDALEEAADLVMYLAQSIIERDGEL